MTQAQPLLCYRIAFNSFTIATESGTAACIQFLIVEPMSFGIHKEGTDGFGLQTFLLLARLSKSAVSAGDIARARSLLARSKCGVRPPRSFPPRGGRY